MSDAVDIIRVKRFYYDFFGNIIKTVIETHEMRKE